MKKFALLSLLLLVFSCVPNRKYVYIQKNDLHKSDLELNKVIREHVVDSFNYRIQPNDILSIRFESLTSKSFDFLNSQQSTQAMMGGMSAQGNPLLIGELVDEYGQVTLPGIGSISVAGLTIFQIQKKLEVEATKYVTAPIVRVRLLNYRITVMGEVNQEGVITLMNNRVSILEALGLAGGLNEFADKSIVKLVRQTNTKAEVIYLNLLDENLIDSPYYYVHQNDILIVPALRQRPYRKYFSQNFSLALSVITLTVLILNL